jgi:hypothetical protein
MPDFFGCKNFKVRFFLGSKFFCPEIFARENFKARNFSADKIFSGKKFCVSERVYVGGFRFWVTFFHDQAGKSSR